MPDISKFSWAELFSNNDGKTSGTAFVGVLICTTGTLCFLMGCIDKMFIGKSLDIINQSIMFGNLTNDQLNSIIGAVKFARTQLLQQNKRSLRIGSDVKFVNSRNGQTVMGKVTSIKTKNVIVAVGLSNWRVPANMLEVV